MKLPALKEIAVTTVPDQIGKPIAFVVGLDLNGNVWQKYGELPWMRVSQEATH